MAVLLYDLAAGDDRRLSPYCWRTKLALAHKGIAFETRGVGFTAIPRILDGSHRTVPVLVDGERVVADSLAIADYLDATHPDRPRLFASPAERALANFMHDWTFATVNMALLGLIVLDIWERCAPEDQAYFRASREKRLGRTLEEVQAGRESRVEAFRASLSVLRQTLGRQPFLGGDAPCYADYVVFGSFQWARVISPFRVLADDDLLHGWIGRVLDLHGGLARKAPAYW